MTEEKKKRGRPPGSGKKKEVVGPFNPDKLQKEVDEVFKPSKMEAIAEVMENVELANRAIAKLRQNPATSERSYPSNWGELGKVAKLQWLTEHRK
jgi:hypothetical protein